MAEPPSMVPVYAGLYATAALIKQLLEQAGVRAFLRGEAMCTIGGWEAAEVMVGAEHAAEAAEIVESFLRAEPEAPSNEDVNG